MCRRFKLLRRRILFFVLNLFVRLLQVLFAVVQTFGHFSVFIPFLLQGREPPGPAGALLFQRHGVFFDFFFLSGHKIYIYNAFPANFSAVVLRARECTKVQQIYHKNLSKNQIGHFSLPYDMIPALF